MSKRRVSLFVAIILILIVLLSQLGNSKFWALLGQIWEAFWGLFSIFGPKAIEDYVTSPYFITKIIVLVASCFGVWFSVKGKKKLLAIVSFVCAVSSFISMFI